MAIKLLYGLVFKMKLMHNKCRQYSHPATCDCTCEREENERVERQGTAHGDNNELCRAQPAMCYKPDGRVHQVVADQSSFRDLADYMAWYLR